MEWSNIVNRMGTENTILKPQDNIMVYEYNGYNNGFVMYVMVSKSSKVQL